MFTEISWLENKTYKYYINTDSVILRKTKKSLACKVLMPYIRSINKPDKRLCLNINKRTYNVHILMAMTYLNKTFKNGGLTVNHIDYNPYNNKLSNLEMVTHFDNIVHYNSLSNEEKKDQSDKNYNTMYDLISFNSEQYLNYIYSGNIPQEVLDFIQR